MNVRKGEHESSLFKEAVNRRLFSSDLSKNELLASSREMLTDFNVTNSLTGNDYDEETSFSVPFLCPIVLRKELENVVASEGDDCLTDSTAFIEHHPILYWNLLYIFQRISAPTHFVNWLPSYVRRVCYPNDEGDLLPVIVRCVYDCAKVHEKDEAKPVYLNCFKESFVDDSESNLMRALLIEHRAVSRSVVMQIVDYLSVPNLHKPIQLMINENRKRSTPRSNSLPRHFSIYRDILFLALISFDKDLRIDDFDREYSLAFAKLPPKIASMLPTKDRPPSVVVRACRKVFMPLDAC